MPLNLSQSNIKIRRYNFLNKISLKKTDKTGMYHHAGTMPHRCENCSFKKALLLIDWWLGFVSPTHAPKAKRSPPHCTPL
jgi:hypothetical protein